MEHAAPARTEEARHCISRAGTNGSLSMANSPSHLRQRAAARTGRRLDLGPKIGGGIDVGGRLGNDGGRFGVKRFGHRNHGCRPANGTVVVAV